MRAQLIQSCCIMRKCEKSVTLKLRVMTNLSLVGSSCTGPLIPMKESVDSLLDQADIIHVHEMAMWSKVCIVCVKLLALHEYDCGVI